MQSMMSLVNNPQFTDTPRMICVADDFSVHSLKRDNVRQIDANISDLAGNLEAVPVWLLFASRPKIDLIQLQVDKESTTFNL